MRLLLTLIVLLATLSSPVVAQNYVFGPNVRVNDDSPGTCFRSTYSPGQHCIAARGDTVYLVWRDDRGSNSHIYFARSDDAGRTFGPNVQVDQSVAGIVPSLAVDDSGAVHVCWLNYNTSGMGGRFVHYTRSIDGGRTFLPSVRACDSLSDDGYAIPSLAVSRSGRSVCVVRDEDFRIWLARSTDGGTSFVSPNTMVQSDTGMPCWNASAAVYGALTIVVAWNDRRRYPDWCRTYFARSTNGGATFDTALMLNDTIGNTNLRFDPSVGVDSRGRVFVVYTGGDARGQLGLVVSNDTGRTFDHERGIPLTWGNLTPSITVAPSGQLYVGWTTVWDNCDRVRFIYSPDGGTTFQRPVNPSDFQNDSVWQSVITVTANAQGRVFAAWADGRNDIGGFSYDIYCAAASSSAVEDTTRAPKPPVSCEILPVISRWPVRIVLRSERSERVKVDVADGAGRVVASIMEGTMPAGHQTLEWSGRDADGTPVGAGVYFVWIRTQADNMVRKLILLTK